MSEGARSRRKESDRSSRRGPVDEEYSSFNIFNWAQFLSERAPPLVFLLLASGPCLTGLYIVEGKLDWAKFIWAVFGELVLLLLIRVMDDVKDYKLDCDIHPDRPLPRGLIKYDEVTTVIQLVLGSMSMYACVMAWKFSLAAGITFGIQVLYCFLMYIEFGIKEWLESHVLVNAILHQISIYFGAWFICALAGEPWYSKVGFVIGSTAFSGFFTYEICRKLDPTLPLRKGTYLVVYGQQLTFLFVCITVAIGAVSSWAIGLNWLLWPMEALMLLSVFVLFLFQRPTPGTKAHKPVEVLSIVYILLHMWSGYIASFWKA